MFQCGRFTVHPPTRIRLAKGTRGLPPRPPLGRTFCYSSHMPANLTPQYIEAEKRFKQAQGVSEKIAALEEMMATIPKHKGTEKLQADLKKKMSGLRKDAEHAKKSGSRREPGVVEREGARQLVLVGAPNSGKSQLLRCLTNALPEV